MLTRHREALDSIWKDVMLNQFHDVIPGTSIRMANEDAWAIYDTRSAEAEGLIQQALSVLMSDPVPDKASTEQGHPITILDPLRFARQEVIEAPLEVSEQLGHLWAETDVTGIGHVTEPPISLIGPSATVSGDQGVLENAHFRLTISEGRLKSLVDIQLQRELILPGPGADDAGLMLYDDLPLAYDAWDAEIYHLDQCRVIKFTKVEVGAQDSLRASIRATAEFGSSTVVLTVGLSYTFIWGRYPSRLCSRQFSLDAVSLDSPLRSHVRVHVQADWREKHRFLKCKFRGHVPNNAY